MMGDTSYWVDTTWHTCLHRLLKWDSTLDTVDTALSAPRANIMAGIYNRIRPLYPLSYILHLCYILHWRTLHMSCAQLIFAVSYANKNCCFKWGLLRRWLLVTLSRPERRRQEAAPLHRSIRADSDGANSERHRGPMSTPSQRCSFVLAHKSNSLFHRLPILCKLIHAERMFEKQNVTRHQGC